MIALRPDGSPARAACASHRRTPPRPAPPQASPRCVLLRIGHIAAQQLGAAGLHHQRLAQHGQSAQLLGERPRHRGFAGTVRPQQLRCGARSPAPAAPSWRGQIHLGRRLDEFDFPLGPRHAQHRVELGIPLRAKYFWLSRRGARPRSARVGALSASDGSVRDSLVSGSVSTPARRCRWRHRGSRTPGCGFRRRTPTRRRNRWPALPCRRGRRQQKTRAARSLIGRRRRENHELCLPRRSRRQNKRTWPRRHNHGLRRGLFGLHSRRHPW